MERGLARRFSPPLRRVERGPGGEVNISQIRDRIHSFMPVRP
jgi:hypothetical protein